MTLATYESAMRVHLVPKFGDLPLVTVANGREEMTLFLRSLPVPTAKRVYTALQAMLYEAEQAGRIHGHRLGRIRLDAVSRRAEFSFPTHAQLEAIAAALPEKLKATVWIMRGCGLRLGEVAALRAEDFSGGKVRVCRQQLRDGTAAPLKARKAGDYRDVPVPGYVADAVASLAGTNGPLFKLDTSNFSKRLGKAAREAGLENFTAHSLRHVFASICLAQGVPITDVGKWLGHRDISVTYGTYGHLVPDAGDRARKLLDAEYAEWRKAA
jgi:integrase